MGWCGFSTNGIIALVRALQLGNVSTPVQTTQLSQALSRGFFPRDGSVCHHWQKKHQTFAILFLKLSWELLKSFFVLFFSSGEFHMSYFLGLWLGNVAISVTSPTKVGFRNLNFCCNIPFILESRRHFLMRYNFEGINMPMSGKHLDETHRPCKPGGNVSCVVWNHFIISY